MADIKPTTIPAKRLSKTITAASTTFELDNITGWDGNNLTSSDFGSVAYASLRNSAGTLLELIEFDPSTIASSQITINKRGLKFDGTDLTTQVTANKLSWIKGDTIVELGTHHPQLLGHYVDILAVQTINGAKTFVAAPASSVAATAATELVRKNELDAAVLGSLTNAPVVLPGNAGETVTIDQLVFLDPADQEWKLADADTASTVENIKLGITRGAGVDGGAIANGVTVLGEHVAASAIFTAGKVFASNTAGGFATSAGTTEVSLGIAKSTTKIDFLPRYDQRITEDEQGALAAASGTPSDTNRYEDENDTTNAAAITATTIAFVDSNPDTITDSGSGFVTAGFKRGQTITVSGSGSNNATFTIASVVAGTITLVAGDALVVEAAGATVTIVAATIDKLLRLNASGEIPAVDGSKITGIVIGTSKIATDVTPVTVANTTTETTLLSVSILANTLSTNNAVRFNLAISNLQFTISNTITIRLKYGSTTIGTANIVAGFSGASQGNIEGIIVANAATNAQKGMVKITSSLGAANVPFVDVDTGTAAEDSTGALNLVISAEWTTANAGSTITYDHAVIESIT